MTRTHVAAAAILVAVLAAGCSSKTPSETPEAESSRETAATTAFGDADVRFVLDAGATLTSLLTTAQFAESRSQDADVAELAADIVEGTGPRVDEVAGWVRTWGEQGAELGHDAVPHGLPGGVGFSPDVVDRLHTVSAARFDGVFLPALVEHLRRVQAVAADQAGEGRHPGAVRLADATADDAARWLEEARRLAEGAR